MTTRKPRGAPLRQSIFKSACLEAVLAQCGDGLKRKHAIGPTADLQKLAGADESLTSALRRIAAAALAEKLIRAVQAQC